MMSLELPARKKNFERKIPHHTSKHFFPAAPVDGDAFLQGLFTNGFRPDPEAHKR